jgi:hypothetical protein
MGHSRVIRALAGVDSVNGCYLATSVTLRRGNESAKLAEPYEQITESNRRNR